MKNLILVVAVIIITSSLLQAQFPNLEVQDTSDVKFRLPDYVDGNNNYLVSFWATWCSPCKAELDAWQAYSQNWIDNHSIKIIGLSIDTERSKDRAVALWNDREWDGELLFTEMDSASVLLNFQTIPRVFLFDKNGDVIYDHTGYVPGDEEELDNFITGNLTSNTFDNIETPTPLQTYQDQNNVYVKAFGSENISTLNIYSIEGKTVGSFTFSSSTQIFEVPKSLLSNNLFYVFDLSTPQTNKSKLVFIK
ncbi:MAG: TlpA family protein disulfide reductase [Saprospiraceae bacterium]